MHTNNSQIYTRIIAILLIIALTVSQPLIIPTYGQENNMKIARCTVHIAAVSSAGGGVLGNLTVEIHWPGEGRVFISTSPAAEVDTQGSARLAAFAASMLAGVDPLGLDFYYDIESPSIIIGGPSAGAAMALATLNLLLGVPCNQSIVATGMIEPDGTIGPVGGLKEKLEAVADAGGKMFLIPSGQEVYTYTQKKIERIGPLIIVRNQPVTVNLTSLGEQLGVQVLGIPSLLAALRAEGYNIESPTPWNTSLTTVVDTVFDQIYRQLENNYTSLQPGSNRLANTASQYYSSAQTLHDAGLSILSTREIVKALAQLQASQWLDNAESNNLKVTSMVENVNDTIEQTWNTLSNITPTTVEQAGLLIEAYKTLAHASLHYSQALHNLETSGGDYLLPYSLFTGIDTQPLIDLALAKWLTIEASLIAQNIGGGGGEPLLGNNPDKVASLLTATARSAAAYLYTLLQEAGGDTGAAEEALYLADTAVTASNPWEAIGASLDAIVSVTTTIYNVFPVPPEAAASALLDEAKVILARNGTTLLSIALVNESARLNATIALQFLSEAILTGWTTQVLAASGFSPVNVGEWNAPPVTSTWTSNQTIGNQSGGQGEGGTTGGASGGEGVLGGNELIALSAGVLVGAVAALAIIMSLERRRGASEKPYI